MEWRPIADYDAMPAKKRPARAVFYFAPVDRGRRPEASLGPMVAAERVRGNRVCTHYIPLPADPA